MLECGDHQVLKDGVSSRPDRLERRDSPQRQDLSARVTGDHHSPRVTPRFTANDETLNRAERAPRCVGSGGETSASRKNMSAPSSSDPVAAAPGPRFGQTAAAAAEFAREEAPKGSWSWSPNHAYLDQPKQWSARMSAVSGAGPLALLATLLVGVVISGGVVGVALLSAKIQPPLGLARHLGGVLDGTASATERPTTLIAADEAVVDRILPPRASPPQETSSPVGDVTSPRGVGIALDVAGSMVKEKRPEPPILESHSTITTLTSLREAEEEPPTKQPVTAASSTPHSYKVQLGLFIEAGNATLYWNRVSDNISLIHGVDKTTIKNVQYYRLYAGQFATLEEASMSCDEMKKNGIDCFVVD